MMELMGSGLELMMAGMGIVFLFLAMLVAVINGLAHLIERYFPEQHLPVTHASVSTTANDKHYVAAISAAVHKYRSRH